MTANDYVFLAMRTSNKSLTDDERLRHGVFGLCSESGEVAGLFQKVYQGHTLDREHLVKELGDCLWMIAEIVDNSGMDITLEEVMRTNIDKLKARFPEGFEAEKSLNRKEGDV